MDRGNEDTTEERQSNNTEKLSSCTRLPVINPYPTSDRYLPYKGMPRKSLGNNHQERFLSMS